MGRAVRRNPSLGKDYTQSIRQTPQALTILHEKFGVSEL